MRTADKLVENTLLTAVSRVAMALSIPMFLAIVGFIWGIYISNVDLDKRVTVLEGKYSEISRQLQVLDVRSISILEAVARLEARQTADK